MRVRILGSAAGGGVPQWNCRCPNCAAARAGSADVRPAHAVICGYQRRWPCVVLAQRIPRCSAADLGVSRAGPAGGRYRGTGIVGCVLTDAELDHTAGLLLLREGGRFRIYCTSTVRRWLNRHLPIEPILAKFAKPMWSDSSWAVLSN